MKLQIVCLICVMLLAFGIGSVSAELFVYPTQDAPMFTIEMPDKWNSEVIEETILQSVSPDEKVYMMLWPVDAETIEEAVDGLEEFLTDLLTDITLDGEGETREINGIPFWHAKGQGKDVETDDDVSLTVGFFLPEEKTVCLIVFLAEPKAAQRHAESIAAIFQSIKKP